MSFLKNLFSGSADENSKEKNQGPLTSRRSAEARNVPTQEDPAKNSTAKFLADLGRILEERDHLIDHFTSQNKDLQKQLDAQLGDASVYRQTGVALGARSGEGMSDVPEHDETSQPSRESFQIQSVDDVVANLKGNLLERDKRIERLYEENQNLKAEIIISLRSPSERRTPSPEPSTKYQKTVQRLEHVNQIWACYVQSRSVGGETSTPKIPGYKTLTSREALIAQIREKLIEHQTVKPRVLEEQTRKLTMQLASSQKKIEELEKKTQTLSPSPSGWGRPTVTKQKTVQCLLAVRDTDSDDFRQAVRSFLSLVENDLREQLILKTSETGSAPLANIDRNKVLILPCLNLSRLDADVDGVFRYWRLDPTHGAKDIVLVIFHHKDETSSRLGLTPSIPAMSGRSYIKEVVDVVFWRNKGVYQSDQNTQAVYQMTTFLRGC